MIKADYRRIRVYLGRRVSEGWDLGHHGGESGSQQAGMVLGQ